MTIEEKLDLASKQSTFGCILNSFLKGVQAKNEEIQHFRFFDSKVGDHSKVTKAEEAFLKKYACLDGDTLQPKDAGCFTLS